MQDLIVNLDLVDFTQVALNFILIYPFIKSSSDATHITTAKI